MIGLTADPSPEDEAPAVAAAVERDTSTPPTAPTLVVQEEEAERLAAEQEASGVPAEQAGATAELTADPRAAAAASPSSSTAKNGCEPVGPEMLAALAEGQEDGVGGMTFTQGAAVRSPEHAKAYLIAGRFDAPGINGEVGVWASNALTPGEGLMMSVDGMAQEFTVWPDADTTDARITAASPGVAEAKACLS